MTDQQKALPLNSPAPPLHTRSTLDTIAHLRDLLRACHERNAKLKQELASKNLLINDLRRQLEYERSQNPRRRHLDDRNQHRLL